MIVSTQQCPELLLSGDKPQVLAIELHQVEAPNAEDLLAVVAGMERPEIRAPSFLQATTSPSMIALVQGRLSTASRMPGKRFVKSRPFLERMRTSWPALWGWQR